MKAPKVKLRRGENNYNNDALNLNNINLKQLNADSRLLISRNILKSRISIIVQSILKDTGMSIINNVNRIVDNEINLKYFINKPGSETVLMTMIFNELYRLTLEATLITDIDYANYLNASYSTIENIVDEVIDILNCI